MVVRFNGIDISNFMSFEHARISLEDGGYVLVQGINESKEDCSSSNGSGKSSLWEAISWCLTGDTIRGSKDISNLYTQDGACVTLTFSVNGDEYIVRRSRDHSVYKTNLFISVNGEDKSGKGIRDGDAILSTLLPDVTPDLIGSVILLGQGLPCRLSSRTPAGRKELLEKLTKSDFMIEDIKNKISARKDFLSSSMRTIDDNILKMSVEKKYCADDLDKNKHELESLPTIDSYYSERDALSQKLSELCDKDRIVRKEYDFLYSQLQEVQNKKASVSSEWYSQKERISLDYSVKIEEIRNRVSELKSELMSLCNEKRRIESITDICPTCGQKIPGIQKPSTHNLDAEIDELSKKLSFHEDTISQQKNILDCELRGLDEKYSGCTNEVDQQLSELSVRLGAIDRQRRDFPVEIASVQSRISILDSRIEEYQRKKDGFETSIRSCEDKIKELSEKELYYNIEKQRIQSHIDVVSKMSTMANRDFRGYLLSSVVGYIDGVTKEYSSRVFGSPCVSFSLNGNSLDIKLFDKYYESLSGGEKQRVDLIVQFAIRKMLCDTADFSSNIIVLDEIFDGMDAVSAKQVIDFIADELTDLETIFIVTHHTDLQIPYDNIIKVVKDNSKISRIVT